MRTWITSGNGALTVTTLIAAGTGLALLGALVTQGISARTITACLLVLCFVVFTFGGVLFSGRAFLNWQIGDMSAHLLWERGFVIGGIVFTALGLALLEDLLRAAGETVLSRLGILAYLIGAAVALVAETAYLDKRDWHYPQIVLYVVLAFLGQALLGASLLHSGLVSRWVGWVTILWNAIWLPVLLIFSPRNMYFPVLHHVAPLMIGIALLAGR
ncbi:MAG: hypothetical protein KME04_14960 [Pleurocapsa minor GSE-CHR-MK-17-07R]|jgi:sugar phosphate permease|nr:hypothetical protein [Pleurocapsa minor GSE-CHR-MK 17-07R]